VVSDRFADSTLAYQGYGHGLDLEFVRGLYDLVLGDFSPDLTLILDIAPAEGLARATARAGGEDRYERMDITFHERLREGFLKIAASEPERCVVIDAGGEIDAVAGAMLRAVQDRLGV
jgi:dTMP kinase